MSDRKHYYKLLDNAFNKKFGFRPTSNNRKVNWNLYKATNFEERKDDKGFYLYDKRTGERVTKAYEKKLKSQMGGAVTNLWKLAVPINTKQIGAQLDVLDKKAELSIAKDRSKNPFGLIKGKQYIDDATGTVKDKTQEFKNQKVSAAQSKYDLAIQKRDNIPLNYYRSGLDSMGISYQGRNFETEYGSVQKDGSIMIPDVNGKLHKTYPNDSLGHYKKFVTARNRGKVYEIGAEEAKVRTNNKQAPSPNPNPDLPNTVKEYSSRAERKQKNQSLKINNKVEVQEENGSTTDYTDKYKQIGNLMINPGGLVGRNADVRRSDKRSTTLSIAQADFGSIKKGEQLGVMSTRERELYDRDVLQIG